MVPQFRKVSGFENCNLIKARAINKEKSYGSEIIFYAHSHQKEKWIKSFTKNNIQGNLHLTS